ncbi:acyl carrier protein [Streptomyces sp. NA02950]|uniref:acyl carrier protein n=1 Tax=Streptomyces sp. NA02950 TaxID=2742137 RepID=UPI00159053AE|nr:acyl carrier protein [Streptomyces sp. NA02950]QKV90558.1 acyl carrier protein [Streptomyces sp. NA02950]
MKDLEEFIALIREEIGLLVTVEDAERGLHDLPGWDSVHLLWLVTALEEWAGRSVSVIDLLEAPSLASIYGLVAAD